MSLRIAIVPNEDLRLLLPEDFRREKEKRKIMRNLCAINYIVQYGILGKLGIRR